MPPSELPPPASSDGGVPAPAVERPRPVVRPTAGPDYRAQERMRRAVEQARVAEYADALRLSTTTARRHLRDHLARERAAAREIARQERAPHRADAMEYQACIELARLLGALEPLADLAAPQIARLIVSTYRQALMAAPEEERAGHPRVADLDQRTARADVAARIAPDLKRQFAEQRPETIRMQRLWYQYLYEWVRGRWGDPPAVALLVARVAKDQPQQPLPPPEVQRDLKQRARAERAFASYV